MKTPNLHKEVAAQRGVLQLQAQQARAAQVLHCQRDLIRHAAHLLTAAAAAQSHWLHIQKLSLKDTHLWQAVHTHSLGACVIKLTSDRYTPLDRPPSQASAL